MGVPHSRILLKLISLSPRRVHFGAYPYPVAHAHPPHPYLPAERWRRRQPYLLPKCNRSLWALVVHPEARE